MHTRSSGLEILTALDPEIEATARKQAGERRRKTKGKVMGEVPAKALREHGMPDATGVLSSIVRPTITATHF